MATILTGSIVAEIAGSVGTEAYSRNAYGPYVKARKSPTNPNTVPQQNARANVTAAVLAWQALTDPQRTSYIVEARARSSKNRLGIRTQITGYHLFIRQYMLAKRQVITPPTTIEPPQLTSSIHINSVTAVTGSIIANVQQVGISQDTRFALFATNGRSAGQMSFNPSTTRFMNQNFLNSLNPANIAFTSAYETAFGLLSGKIGQRLTVGIYTYRTESAELLKTQYTSALVA